MKSRTGHSLIEMLVVLIIVGVLIAIVVPAVQRSRESARQAQCIHNQGQLAKAIHLHLADEPYGRFPGFRAFASDGTTQLGWAAQVAEHLGRSDLDLVQPTYVEVLVCPSNQGPQDSPRLNYVVNGGQAGIDSPADGIFYDHAKPAGERVYITRDDFRDGLTNTIMLSENLDATRWNVTDEVNQCILWPLVSGNEINHGSGARPSSHHPGGFVAAFADGAVKFMTETEINDDTNVHTDQSIYVALLTPGGNDVTGSPDGGGGGSGSSPCVSNVPSLDQGLRAHYEFDDADDPGMDSTGSYDGIVIGAPAVDDGERCGKVLHFSEGGSSDTGDVMNLPDGVLHGVGDLTIALWIKIEGTVPVWFIHAYGPGGGSTGDNNSTSFGWSGAGTFGMYNHGAFTVWPSTAAPTSGWFHLAMIRDVTNHEHRLFFDGQEFAGGAWGSGSETTLEPTNISPGALQVGQEQDCLAGCWEAFQRLEGPIDDLRFYERVLTDEEIATLAGQ